MPDYIGHKPGAIDNILFALVIGSMVLLFAVVISRTANETPEKFKADCKARGGVMIEHKTFLGTGYDCAGRLD